MTGPEAANKVNVIEAHAPGWSARKQPQEPYLCTTTLEKLVRDGWIARLGREPRRDTGVTASPRKRPYAAEELHALAISPQDSEISTTGDCQSETVVMAITL
jgi:hypothetical protein